jgi:hypothetical protein
LALRQYSGAIDQNDHALTRQGSFSSVERVEQHEALRQRQVLCATREHRSCSVVDVA